MPGKVVMDMTYVRSPGEVGGSEELALSLLDELLRRGRRAELLLVANREGCKTLRERGVHADVEVPISRPGLLRWPVAGAATALASIFSKAERVLWMGGLAFPAVLARSILVILDIGPLVTPYYPGLRTRVLRALLPPISRRVAHVLTISQFSKREIARVLRVQEARITVVPVPLSPAFSSAPAVRPVGVPEGGKFIFCLDDGKLHKNVALLVDLYLERRAKEFAEHSLVIAGRASSRWHRPEIGVRGLGYVSDGELRHLYESASVVAIPSLYEGYGRPVAEALSVGGTVACSSRGSLPEVGGGFVTLFDPEDPESLRSALARCVHSGPVDSQTKRDRVTWAKQRSWVQAGDVLDEVLFEGTEGPVGEPA